MNFRAGLAAAVYKCASGLVRFRSSLRLLRESGARTLEIMWNYPLRDAEIIAGNSSIASRVTLMLLATSLSRCSRAYIRSTRVRSSPAISGLPRRRRLRRLRRVPVRAHRKPAVAGAPATGAVLLLMLTGRGRGVGGGAPLRAAVLALRSLRALRQAVSTRGRDYLLLSRDVPGATLSRSMPALRGLGRDAVAIGRQWALTLLHVVLLIRRRRSVFQRDPDRRNAAST